MGELKAGVLLAADVSAAGSTDCSFFTAFFLRPPLVGASGATATGAAFGVVGDPTILGDPALAAINEA